MTGLLTSRLVLRSFRDEDASAVEQFVGDAELALMVGHIPHPYPAGGALAWIRHTRPVVQQDLLAQFAVTERANGALVGCLSLKRAGPDSSEAELAYWIGKPFWGRGYATEAGSAAIDDVCARWSSESVWAGVLEHNTRSVRVLAKLGLAPDGAYTVVRPARGGSVSLLRFRRILNRRADEAGDVEPCSLSR